MIMSIVRSNYFIKSSYKLTFCIKTGNIFNFIFIFAKDVVYFFIFEKVFSLRVNIECITKRIYKLIKLVYTELIEIFWLTYFEFEIFACFSLPISGEIL